MNVPAIAASLVAAYLLGSIPTAYIIGRVRKKGDIRQIGTRNMGAMNTFYEVGFWWGMVVLAVDIGKGMAAMAIGEALQVPEPAYLGGGALAVLGHTFPVFLGFRGGKGGATTMGVLVWLMKWWSFAVYPAVFGLLFLITRAPTISYSLAFACFPVLAWWVYGRWEWAAFSVLLVMVPLARYVPRIKEMRERAGNWRRVFQRKSVRDRF